MCSVKMVFKEIMTSGYDPFRQALDVVLVPDLDNGIGNHSVRLIQGLTRATCLITIITCAIHVVAADPGLAQDVDSVASLLESCVTVLCNFRMLSQEDEFYEMLRLPGLFPCFVGANDALRSLQDCLAMSPVCLVLC
jgi:hypothetical protein